MLEQISIEEAETIYRDLMVLETTGCWENGIRPQWANEVAEQLNTHSGFAIGHCGWEAVAKRLARELGW